MARKSESDKNKENAEKQDAVGLLTLDSFYKETVLPVWEATVGTATYKSYEGGFRVHVSPVLGSLPVTHITRKVVKDFVISLRKKTVSVRAKKEQKKPETTDTAHRDTSATELGQRLLSKETIRLVVASLRSVLNEAIEEGLLSVNHATKLGKFYKDSEDFHDEVDAFTREEVSILLLMTQTKLGFENYVALLTLFHCGLRAGELAGLNWSDLDVKNKLLLVRKQFGRERNTKHTKTRRKRSVDVSTVLLSELLTLKKQRQAEFLAKGKNEIPDAIFLGPGVLLKDEERGERTRLDMDNFRNRVFGEACDAAKIRRRPLHHTRHTFASILLTNGETLKYVSSQLGHSSIRITADTYGHLEVGANRAAMDRLPTLPSVSSQTATA
jgi:integrase